MNLNHGRLLRGAWFVVASLLVVVTATGCASKDGFESRWWRQGTVLQKMNRSAIPTDINAECAEPRDSSAPPGADDAFALVQFRAGRAPYVKLFPIDKGLSLNVGDHVDVEPGACKLRRRNVEGA